MTIHVSAFGPLRRYFGNDKRSLEMPPDATVGTVLEAIDRIWGDALPPDVWDREKRQFMNHVTILLNSARVTDSSQKVSDGADFYLMEFMVGG